MTVVNRLRRWSACLSSSPSPRPQPGHVRLAGEGLEERATPATITVTGLGDLVSNNGLVSLREAITAINQGANFSDVVAQGVYGVNDTIRFAGNSGTINLTGELPSLINNMTIQGPQDPVGITINGQPNGNFRLFAVGDSANGMNAVVTIFGLNYTNGHNNGIGGAVFVDQGSTLTLTGYTFSNNSSVSSGGAIYNAGTLNLQFGGFDHNTAVLQGGAIQNASTGTLNMLDSNIVTGNQATQGGGIYNLGTAAIERVIISGNAAVSAGAGAGTDQGGGIFNDTTTTLTLTNVIVSSNTARDDGGGLFNQTGAVTMRNVTFTGNVADSDGAGGGVGGGIRRQGGTVTMHNTLVAGNFVNAAPGDVQGQVTATSSANLIGVAFAVTNITNNDANGNLVGAAAAPIDARITPVANALIPGAVFYLLQPGSPAIDTGNGARAVDPQGNPLQTDMPGPFGVPRVLDGDGDNVAVVDIGALEMVFNTPPVLAAIPPQLASVGQTLTFTAAATDPQAVFNQSVTYSLVSAPAGTSIDPVTGVVTFTPGGTQAGITTVVVRATDNGNPVLSADQSVTLFVQPKIETAVLSRVKNKPGKWALTLTFDGMVTLTPASFQLLQRTKARLKFKLSTQFANGKTIATLTYTGTRANYGTLKVVGSQVVANGLSLANQAVASGLGLTGQVVANKVSLI